VSGPGRDDPARLAGLVPRHIPADVTILEFHGWKNAQARRGATVLTWRGAALEAQSAGVATIDPRDPAQTGRWRAALVHVGKGRAATETDLALAWRTLAPGGDLFILGANDLGVATYAKRFATAVGAEAELVGTGGRGRLLRVCRNAHSGPDLPTGSSVPSDDTPNAVPLHVAPGVFSHDGLDRGTALVLTGLDGLPTPSRVIDFGCGAGHLAIAALRRWPNSRALLLDADRRAVACASDNLASLGLADRAEVRWWCEREPLADPCDLALINPPCHAGVAVDLTVAKAFFARAAAVLTPGGHMLIVANRSLPYEAALKQYGTLSVRCERDGFKLIDVCRA
jgi:16S rRNA (guanine1207-N2)-methyltransferase